MFAEVSQISNTLVLQPKSECQILHFMLKIRNRNSDAKDQGEFVKPKSSCYKLIAWNYFNEAAKDIKK